MLDHKPQPLSDEDLDAVTDRVLERVQAQIGRTTVSLITWVLAAAVTGLIGWVTMHFAANR